MRNEEKSKAQLITELVELRQENTKLKQTNKLLRESEDKYRLLVETMNDGLGIQDEKGIVTYVNDRMCEILGYSKEELIGRPVMTYMAEPYKEAFKQAQIERKQGKSNLYELGLQRKDGTQGYTLASAKPIFDTKGNIVGSFAVITDITERKLAEQKLLETTVSKNYMDNIVSSMVEALIVVNSDATIRTVNQATLNLLGYEEEEMIGMSVMTIMPKEEHGMFHGTGFEELIQKGAVQGLEKTYLTKDNQSIPVLFSGSVMQDEKGAFEGIVCVAQDMSERKEAEEKLKKQKDYIESLHNSLGEAILNVKMPERVIEYVNQSLETIFGYQREECLGQTTAMFYPEEQRYVELGKKLKQAIDNKLERLKTETLLKRKNGKLFDAEITTTFLKDNGIITNVISIIRDISEQKKANEQLIRFHNVLEQSLHEIYFFHAETLQFLDVNWGARKNLGYSLEELKNLTPLDLKPEFTPSSFARLIEPLKSGTKKKITFTTAHRRKNGTQYPVEVHLQLITVGTPIFVAIILDITARVELESQLLQAQKREALGTLAGGIAHDFNNLLVPILGLSEIAKNKLDPESEQVKHLKMIAESARRAKDLVSQILTVGRQSKFDKQTLSPKDVVEEALKLLRASIPTHISILQEIAPNLPKIDADPSQLHQVIMNLGINAAHAMPEGGVLTISLTSVPHHEFINTKKEKSEGAFVCLKVQDTGIGMHRPTLERIFEPFFSTKQRDSKKGTGLGLAMVLGIVEQHGGHVEVESEVEKGSTFSTYLPIAQAQETKKPLDDLASPLVSQGERILFVEDETMVLETGIMLLEEIGYEVFGFAEGEKALQAFEANPEKFDLVITDYMMPKMTGVQLSERLKKIRPDIPVILCTGYNELATEENLKAWKINESLKKPYGLESMNQTLRNVWAKVKS